MVRPFPLSIAFAYVLDFLSVNGISTATHVSKAFLRANGVRSVSLAYPLQGRLLAYSGKKSHHGLTGVLAAYKRKQATSSGYSC